MSQIISQDDSRHQWFALPGSSLEKNVMDTKASISTRSIQFYVVATKWASDLNFFKIETGFFDRLLEKHFKNLFPSGSSGNLHEINQKLSGLEDELCHIEKKLYLQLREIELMAEDIIPEDIDVLSSVQVQLEFAMASATKIFREVKKELFELIDGVGIRRTEIAK
jgi:hypothetical protein